MSFDNLKFENINSKHGLENAYNHFIFKDEDGFTWLSSTEGVYRFDGNKVIFFSPNQKNSKGLLGKSVQGRFLADSHRNIWFSTSQGINKYNLDSKSFTSLQLSDKDNNLIENDYCLFHIENDSILWTRADWKYIIRYNIKTKHQKIVTVTKGARFLVDTLESGKINRIYACPWIQDSGFEVLNIVDGILKSKVHYLKNGISDTEKKSIEILGGTIQNRDTVWFFSNQGLIRFIPSDSIKNFKQFNLPGRHENIIRDGDIYKKRYLFLAGQESGLWIFDTKTASYINHYINKENNSNSIKNNSIGEIYIDNQNHLWMAGLKSASVDQCWLENNNFINPFHKLNISHPSVNSLIEDLNKRIWCSTDNLGVYLLNQEGDLVNRFKYNTNSNPSFSTIQQLSIDDSGIVWGLNDNYIFMYNNQMQKWMNVFESNNMKLINLGHLSKNTKVVSTNKGVFKLELNNENSSLFIKKKIISSDTAQIFYFYFDESGRFYFPDERNNVFIYQIEKEDLIFRNKLDLKSEIFSIHSDSNLNRIWFGSLNGLFEFDQNSRMFDVKFSKESPLFNAKIYNVIGDDDNRLWLTTNEGLWRYDLTKDEIFQFRLEDGLPSNEFPLFAKLKSTDGKIWLGTNEGLIIFNPDNINPYPNKTNVYIESIKINNTIILIESIFKEDEHLELSHSENSLEFNLIGVSNYLNDLNQIHYFLEGYDDKWQYIKNDESIHYKKLPVGNYTFNFYSSNANGLKGDKKQIKIRVLPPIYLNPMYMLPLLLLLCFVGYKSVRWYFKRKILIELERQKRVYDALQQERNRIAGEMHDDLGGGLHSIKNLIHKIRNVISTDKIPDALMKIENKASDLVENMREIIWAMDASHDSLPELVSYIREHFVNFFDEFDIICRAQIPDEYPESVIISGKQRRNVSLSIKEIAHNIVKHSNATEVELGFELMINKFQIWIKDNGQGINFDNFPVDAHGIRNIKLRMNEIGGDFILQNENGTFIILEIPISYHLKNS